MTHPPQWTQGWEANKRHAPRSTCTFWELTINWNEWMAGWEAAKEDTIAKAIDDTPPQTITA